MQLLTIIVNYRSAALTKDALSSLLPSLAALPSSHVMVVDNASGDDSVPELSAFLAAEPRFSGRVTLHPAPRNGGFAYGNNEPRFAIVSSPFIGGASRCVHQSTG